VDSVGSARRSSRRRRSARRSSRTAARSARRGLDRRRRARSAVDSGGRARRAGGSGARSAALGAARRARRGRWRTRASFGTAGAVNSGRGVTISTAVQSADRRRIAR
jgi:hypothetical protein